MSASRPPHYHSSYPERATDGEVDVWEDIWPTLEDAEDDVRDALGDPTQDTIDYYTWACDDPDCYDAFGPEWWERDNDDG